MLFFVFFVLPCLRLALHCIALLRSRKKPLRVCARRSGRGRATNARGGSSPEPSSTPRPPGLAQAQALVPLGEALGLGLAQALAQAQAQAVFPPSVSSSPPEDSFCFLLSRALVPPFPVFFRLTTSLSRVFLLFHRCCSALRNNSLSSILDNNGFPHTKRSVFQNHVLYFFRF